MIVSHASMSGSQHFDCYTIGKERLPFYAIHPLGNFWHEYEDIHVVYNVQNDSINWKSQ